MAELNLSKNFTIEDIHKVRAYNYERRKNMTFEERKADIEKGAKPLLDRLNEARKEKGLGPIPVI